MRKRHRQRHQGSQQEHKPKFKPRPRGLPGGRRFLGRVQKNPRGFAFILPQDPKMEDAYVGPEEAEQLLNGDLVEFTVQRSGKRSSGQIVKIVERSQKEVIGKLEAWRKGIVIRTLEGEALWVEKEPMGISPDDWVIARFVRYPTKESAGMVEVTERLGRELLPRHDNRVALAKFGWDTSYDPAVDQEADKMVEEAHRELHTPSEKRRDLRHLPFVTIDGEDAKDFDDAILVESPSKGPAFILYVAIADVSFFVRPGGQLDRHARRRTTSIYFPGKAIPMLPELLSNDLCSLNPKTDKLTLNAEIHLNRDGEVEESLFYPAIIKTAARLTYTQVHEFHETKNIDPPSLTKPLEIAFHLFRKLKQKRKERGVLDFDLPEGYIRLNALGEPTELGRAIRHESHKLIEEFMILANREVAKALRSKIPALYRVHETPDPTTLDDINNLMRHLGISKAIKDLTPRSLSKLLESTLDMKGSKTLHKAILRLQKQAHYEPDPRGHFGLALEDYCHFTSPIRRYPDLVVHRALKKLIGASHRSDTKYEEEGYFEKVGTECSELERRAMEAERFVVRRKHCWYMERHVGDIFNGIIGGVTAKGVFVEIPEMVVDGFVPLDMLIGVYEFDEHRQCLRRRPGHTTLSLGDEIKIKVAQVSIDDNEITFAQSE